MYSSKCNISLITCKFEQVLINLIDIRSIPRYMDIFDIFEFDKNRPGTDFLIIYYIKKKQKDRV